MPVGALYVHVPFCASKCSYCAFYSHAPDGGTVNRYVDALVHELEMIAGDCRPRTIFFGGGTPSILTLAQWEKVLEAMHRLKLDGADEWTVECNPATVSLEKARLLRSAGVNRISMGAQTFDEGLLDRLGRVHSTAMIHKSFDTLREAGFNNVNLDLMFAIPTQTLEQFEQSLSAAAQLRPEHLSVYEVIYEQDTPMYEQLRAGKIDANEDLACEMYDTLLERAAAAGWHQYEIANFARHEGDAPLGLPSRACRHNINYWRGGEFHGVGPSATGYTGGVRTRNIANTAKYCERIERGERPMEETEQLGALARAGETAAFGLRMNEGWAFDEFARVTGFDLNQEWAADMGRLVEQNMAVIQSGRFRLTPSGMRFADAAAMEFLR